ncbi:MAG: hypothetical protein HFH45_01350 [Bacilli bacterium]|nr:hypothetical protein [Bacilli bacterium]
MIDGIQGLYDKIYQELKTYLLGTSIYEPSIYKKEVENKKFPKVIVKQLPRDSYFTTLKYGDEIFNFGLEINVYAIQDGDLASATIADEITRHIETFFKDVYRMSVNVSLDIPNADTSVYRNLVQSRCKVDTKFKDKLVIYPIN